MRKYILTILLIFPVSISTFSQELLTLENAVSQAIEKNYSIKIANANLALAHNDNTRGNAGMLPVVLGSSQKTFSNSNINQQFFPVGTTVRDPLVQSGVGSNNSNTNINMVWTIFDGLGMFATADRLKESEKLGKTTTEIAIENTVAQVCGAYYDIIRQKQRIKALKNAIEVSNTRLQLSKDKFEVGTSSKADLLAAQVDYNQDQAALVAQEQALENAKVNLNMLLVRNMNTDFNVPDTIVFRKDLNINQLRIQLEKQNPNLIAANQNRQIAGVSEKEVKARRLPQLDLLGSYGYSTINIEAGFGVKNGRSGILNYGARLSVNVFDGYNQKRREQGAKINSLITEYQESDLKNQLQSALERTYNIYQNSLKLYSFEVDNLKIARQNVELAFERFKVGNSKAIEFREAQRSAIASDVRLIEAAFNIKIAEIELLRLSSSIVEEVK